MLKQLLGWMSPAGKKARLSVLIFHRVLPAPDPFFPDEIDARRFDNICAWLRGWFNILPLDQAVACLKAGTLPARAACITFDDGYADNYHIALPILQSHGLVATFFIATGFLDGGRMWNDTIIEAIRHCQQTSLDLSSLGLGSHRLATVDDRRKTIDALIDQIKYRPFQGRVTVTEQIASLAQVLPSRQLMMTSGEVKRMHDAGMQIGAHTVSHPILARLSDLDARLEIEASKLTLEQVLGERIGLFAYPNGKPDEDYNLQSVAIVRSLGFDAAVSTQWGTSCAGDDLFQLRRFTPWDRRRLRFGVSLLANLRTT